jgi:hypothetical protein
MARKKNRTRLRNRPLIRAACVLAEADQNDPSVVLVGDSAESGE